jgi:hypothetical protein
MPQSLVNESSSDDPESFADDPESFADGPEGAKCESPGRSPGQPDPIIRSQP